MKKLTTHQQDVYDLRQSGKTWAQIGDILGKARGNVYQTYQTANGKMEHKPTALKADSVEMRKPIETAKAIDQLTDNIRNLKQIARNCGLPKSTVEVLAARIERKYMPIVSKIKDIKTSHILNLVEEKLMMVLQNIDEFDIATADLKGKAYAVDILIKNRNLLNNQPTAILSVGERKKINDLIPMLMQEATRRGVIIEGTSHAVNS